MTKTERDQAIILAAMESIRRITKQLYDLGEECAALAVGVDSAMLPHAKKLSDDLGALVDAVNKDLS